MVSNDDLAQLYLRILFSIQTKPGNHSLFERFVLTLDAKELLNQLDDY